MKEMIKKYVASVVCTLATLLITGSALATDAISVGTQLTWSNTEYKGLTNYGSNNGAYSTFKLKIPAAVGLPAGSVVTINEIDFARRSGKTDQKAFLSIGSTGDATKASDNVELDTATKLAEMDRIRYKFTTNPIDVTVETSYNCYALDSASAASAGNMNLHLATPIAAGADVLKQSGSDAYCVFYEIKATVKSIATEVTPPEPLAIWDGFNETVSGNYTATLGSNAVNADGSVTIGSNGIKFETTDSAWSGETIGLTVAVKYSDFTKPSALTTFAALNSSVGNNTVGGLINTDGKMHGCNGGNDYSSGVGSYTIPPTGVIFVRFKDANGTSIHMRDGTKLFENSGLKSSKKTWGNQFSVGSLWDGTSKVAAGLKIEAVAIFNSRLSDDELRAYQFPSEVPSPSPYTGKVINFNIQNTGSDGSVSGKGAQTTLIGSMPETSWNNNGSTKMGTISSGIKIYNTNDGTTADTSMSVGVGNYLSGCGNYAYYGDGGTGTTGNIPNDYYYLHTFQTYRGYTNPDSGIEASNIKLTGIPFDKYDVIVYFNGSYKDGSNEKFHKVNITCNGTSGDYTVDATGAFVAGTDDWGATRQVSSTYGVNAAIFSDVTTADFELKLAEKYANIAAFQIVEQIPPPKATATVNTDEKDTYIDFENLPWDDDITPTKDTDVEITVTGSKPLIIEPMNSDALAKSITFKGESSVQFKTTGLYDGGKITSAIPLVLDAASPIEVDTGANALTYSCIGEISPAISTTGAFTKGGAGTLNIPDVLNPASITVENGVAKFTANSSYGQSKLIKVLAGGQVDCSPNGSKSQWKYEIAGFGPNNTGALIVRNTGSNGSCNVGDGNGAITLTANASINVPSGKTWFFVSPSNHNNTIELNNHTLSLVGAGAFSLSNTTVKNGTIEVKSGTLSRNSGQNKSWAFTNVDLVLDGGTIDVSSALTAGALTYSSGSINTPNNLTVSTKVVCDGAAIPAAPAGAYSVEIKGTVAANDVLKNLEKTIKLVNGETETDVATLDCTGISLPFAGTLDADSNGTIKLPAGFPFGQIIKASAIPANLTITDNGGNPLAADKFEIDENSYITLKKSEITTPYDVNDATIIDGDLRFGTGGSINILNDRASLTLTGMLELPAEGQLPINITLKGEYAKDTAITLITASNGIKKGDADAQLSDFAFTATLLEGMTGELQLSDGNTKLQFVITSDTITAEAADVLNGGHLVRRFDANRGVTTDANNKVTAWTDLTGATAAAPYSAGQVNDQPTLVSGGLRDYLDFGTTGSGKDLRFERLTNAKTVIEVLDIEPKGNAFLLGDSNNYNFHRGGNGQYGDGSNAKFSTVRDNGEEISNWSGTVIPTGFRVISLKLSQNCAADCFSSDRNGNQGRTGGRKLCELLVFDTELTDDDFEAVEDYLTTKWNLAYKNEATIGEGDTRWSALNWGTGKSYVPGSPIEITIGADNARLIYDDATVPVDSIVFKNESGYTYSTAYGADFGAKTVAAGETMVIVGSNDAANPLVYTGALTVNGILKTEGYVDLSYGSGTSGNVVNSGATIEIVNGYTKAKFGDRGMKGTLTIDASAKFASYGYVDAVNYSGTTTVNVYGMLDFTSIDNNQRWTLRNNNTMNFYTGSTIMGDGQSGNNIGALQSNGNNCIWNFKKAGDGDGVVNFSAKIHAQNAFTMNVEDGVTVNMSGSLGTGKNPFTLTGEGTINLTGTYDFNAPVTIGEDATLVIDGGSCAGGYTNNGKIEVKNGNLDMGSKRDFAEFGTVIFDEQGTLSATATPAEYGAGAASFINLPDGLTTLKFIVNGVEQSLAISEGKATYTGPVVIEGAACWYDFTFTNTLTTATGSQNTTTMGKDVGPYYTEAGDAVYTYSRPYSAINFNQEKFAIVLVGKMPTTKNATALSIGTTVANNTGCLLFTTGTTDDIIEISYYENQVTKRIVPVTSMTVPNSTTADHVYIVAKTGPREFVVYLDSLKWKTITMDFDISIGSGLQFGADFGGGARGNPYVTVDSGDPSAFKALRLYNHALSTAEITKYSEVYPYSDPNGESTRTFTAATETWVGATETTPWHYSKGGDEPVEQDQQAAEPGAAVTIAINGGEEVENVEIGVNLAENTSYTGLKVQGSKPVTFAKSSNESGTIAVTGSVTFGVPTTIEYGALDIAGVPLTLAGDATVTFDYSTYSLAGTVRARNVELTGDVDQDAAKFTLIAPTDDIWKAELAYVSGGYVMQISPKRDTPTTLYLTESATLLDDTLFAITEDGEAIMPRLFADDVIYVKTGLTATMPSTALTIKPKFDGVGTIAVNGGTLKNSAPLFTLASTWTGTVEMTNIAMAGDSTNESWFSLNAYGNAASKVKLAGATGYMQHATEFLPEVVLENTSTKAGLEITAGASNSTIIFRKISGTGNLLNNPGSGVTQRMAVGDVSGFTGQVRALQTGGITLGSEENTAGNGQIVVANGTTIAFNGQMWEAANGVSFGATLDVIGAAGNYITMPEQTTLPEITVDDQPTSLMLKYEEGKLMLAQAAASFNGVKYETLAEAIAAANASDEGGTITVYVAWPESDALTVDVDEDKTITLEGVNDACVCNESVVKTGNGTLVINGLINYIEKSFGFAPTISAGTLVLKDGAIASGTFGKSLSLHTEGVKIASDAVLEFNVTEDFILMGGFGDSQIAPGTVCKSGTGKMTLMYDAFATFEGTIDLVDGCIANFDSDMTINCALKVSDDACLDATLESTTKVILGANAKLDLSNIADERDEAVVKGNLKMAEGTAIVFAENQEALLCNGALTIGEEAITGDTTVQDMSIFVDGQEYIADLEIAVAEGESGAKLYTVSYSNATPIIRITTDGMSASDLNAALDEAVEGTKVCFNDGATLTLDENVEDVDLVILGTANIDGEGTISVATIAAAGKTINLGEDVTFVPATPSELSTTTITGEGTIVYDGVLPGDEKSSYQATDWTGTVWLKNYNYQKFDFGALGHSGSKVKLTHIWGYSPNDATSGANPVIVLVDEGSNVALEINDGHGGSKYFFRKLSGDGTFKTSGSQGTNSQYRFYDVSDFEGTFALNGNNKRVVIGTGSTDAGNGQILIDNTATVAIPAGKTWSANNGIKVDGTIGGAGILGSNTTFGNGATIDANAAQLTVEANKTLTFGSSLTVKLASAPEEDSPIKIMNGSFTEQTFETTLTVMVNDQQAEGDFAIKQDANGVWAIANTEVVWTGKGTDRNWSNPDNWQGGIVPTAGRNVVIDVGEATDYSIVIDSNTAAIGSLTVTGAGVVFSGEGTINGPITFTTPKIAGSLKAVGDVTVSASGAVEVTGGMDITGNLMFDGFSNLTFAEGTDISVSGDMTTTATDKHNIDVYFNAGSIEVAETLHTLGRNATYISYHYGDGASENTTMIVRAKTIDASAFGAVYNAYEFRSGATVYVGEGGFNIAGRTAEGETNMASATFNGGKYVATATSTFTVQKNYQVVADSTIEVVDGATLTINNSGKDFGQAGKKITKTGAGTLKFAGTVLTAIDVTAGAVEMTAGDEAGVTVSEGAKLYLKVTAEQKEAGYTSTATIPAGTNIYFILPDGTVVEGVGKILPPKTIVWVGADQGSWDEPSNWSPAVVPLVASNVGFSGEGEGTITIKISDGTRTVEGVIFNSSKNITIDGVVNVTGAITKDGTGTLAINLGADNGNAIAVTAGALEVNVPANTTRVLSGAITGSGKIVKSGEGALHINRANNTGFTGSWDVKGGDLKGLAEKWYGADNNNTPIVLTVNDGATLHLANMGDSAYSLVCNGGTVNNDGTVTGNRYTTGCRQAKNITINGDTTFTGNQFGLLASGYGATTLTFNDNATLTINMNANSAFFMTSTTVSGTGTINVTQGIFSSANNNGTAPVVNEGVKVVVDGGTVKADKNTLTIHTLEYVSGSFASNANAAIKVTGTLSGSSTIPRLTLGDGATIPVTSEITVSNALALDGSIVIDLGATGSGNFHVIAAPAGYEWDTSKVTLSGSDLTDWNVSAEGTTLVVSKLPLDAIVDEDDGYNFDEKVIKVDVKKIDSTLKGTQIKVVTSDKNGDYVSTTLVQIDGSKGMYDVVIGELTAGETYNFKVTFVDSKGDQIDQSKEANLKNIAVGTLIEGEDIFSADASKEEGQREVGGKWETEPTITEGAYVIDDETASVFNVTADDPEGNFTVEYELTFEAGFATELTAEESAPIAGLTIGEGDTDETTNWYRADSTAGTGWSKLDQSVTPGHYIIRMAFTDSTVTYSVKGDEDTDFVTLTQNETTSAFEIYSSAISSVSFQGSSSLAKFGAKTDDTIDTAIANDGKNDLTTIEGVLASLADGKTVTLKTNVAIDTSSLTANKSYKITADGFNLRWDDNRIVSYDSETGTFKITEATPKNGFTSFENYALNLDPTDSDSKPIGVAPADNGKLNTLTVEIKGPDGDDLDVCDGYAIKCIATPKDGGKEVVSTNLKQIDLPLPESGEVQYTIKIEVIKE